MTDEIIDNVSHGVSDIVAAADLILGADGQVLKSRYELPPYFCGTLRIDPAPAVSAAGLVKHIVTTLGVTETLTREFIAVVLTDITLFDRKQHDYGPRNISEFGELGVLIQANNKLARLKNLAKLPGEPSNESMMDSWADLSVYGVIARLCRAGRWPGGEGGPKTKSPPPVPPRPVDPPLRRESV